MGPVGKLIKVLLALALSGLALYLLGSRPAHGSVLAPNQIVRINPEQAV